MKKIADKGSSEALLRLLLKTSTDDCVRWPFRRTATGYGLAVIGGVQKRASRWMCILAHGEPKSPELHAAHRCGVASCVNPKHLYWASPKENAADRVRHGTSNHGERNGKTKLCEQDIRDIRAAPPDLIALAKRYGMNKHSISKIRSGARWGHIK